MTSRNHSSPLLVRPADVRTPRVFAHAVSASLTLALRRVTFAPAVRYCLKRPITFVLVTLLTVTACPAEQPLQPRLAATMAVSGQSVSVGEEILLWTSANFAPGSVFDVTVTGPSEPAGVPQCPAPYPLHVVIHQGPQSGRTFFWSERPLAVGTKLRFVAYVTDCGGFYVAYAFEVTAVPGN